MKRLLATRKRRSAQASAARYLKCVSGNYCAYIHAFIDNVFVLIKSGKKWFKIMKSNFGQYYDNW